MTTVSTDSIASTPSRTRTGRLVLLVFALFFVWGGATSLNDVLVPKLKSVFALGYAEAMLSQFAFFAAYFVFSLPAGMLVARIGYVRGLVVGLAVMATGALLFVPAGALGSYAPYLGALFVLAAGITVLQVASNPLVATLGDPRTASSRLTFAQAFNSLGTTLWPYFGALVLLDRDSVTSTVANVARIYAVIALVLGGAAAVFWLRRHDLVLERPERFGIRASLELLGRRRLRTGAIALFAYVGAEVAIGSLLVNWLELPTTLHLDPRSAGQRLSLYWGGAMIGRFVGSALLRKVRPPTLLACSGAIAVALVVVAAVATGPLAGWALIAVGLFNSIMFPTIFSLAVADQGEHTAQASGVLCMAIVGGAVVPLLAGLVADTAGAAAALGVPVLCYGLVIAFALRERRART